jgi:trimethylamine monooxygenase
MFPGMDKFKGRVLHSHDFRDACEFEKARVLIVGASYSAEDIASQCYKYGCKDIVCSYRTNPMDYDWPKEFEIKPLLTKVEGKLCTFKDGSTREMDAIILCTGYKKHFPFLEQPLQLKSANLLYIENCYKGVVYNGNPKLIYIGMQNQFFTFAMFDAQAWYARDYVLGKITLPSKEE